MSIRSLLAGLVGRSRPRAAGASGEDAFETSSFRLSLPQGWHVDTRSTPAMAEGPNGMIVRLSQTRVTGPGPEEPDAEAREVRDQLEANADRAIQMEVTESGLQEVAPTRAESLPNGAHLRRTAHRSADGRRIVTTFVVVRGRNVLMISVSGRAEDAAAADAVAERVRAIDWKLPLDAYPN